MEETQSLHFLCIVGNKTEDGRVKVIVNKESILDYPISNIDERIVECENQLPFGRTIYVHKAILDKTTRAVKILDYGVLEELKLEVELSNEELAMVESLDINPVDLMEFIYADEDSESDDEEDEDEVSDSEEEE